MHSGPGEYRETGEVCSTLHNTEEVIRHCNGVGWQQSPCSLVAAAAGCVSDSVQSVFFLLLVPINRMLPQWSMAAQRQAHDRSASRTATECVQ
ncbi:unnamed protein product [Knipowitschia caucasica]|uniref:Uncharacterized protein n=1 Tax=Knipowitschia caucasica TaxID=637954 RepID=A0AAV2KUP6_KNICA